jgi:hypothetical protein
VEAANCTVGIGAEDGEYVYTGIGERSSQGFFFWLDPLELGRGDELEGLGGGAELLAGALADCEFF